MPELPEVHTTATILNELISDKNIVSVWSGYNSPYYYGKENIKDPKYFKKFSKEVSGKKILKVWRRAKNVLIDIEGPKTILIHMKMTGHLLYGNYRFDKKKKEWLATDEGPLQDPFNRFIRLVFELSDGRFVAFSDMRKFATIYLIDDADALDSKLSEFGPEPLDDSFTWKDMRTALMKKPKQKIKTALMDQSLVVGIGNIYSDEMLWMSKISPTRLVENITESEFKTLTKNGKDVLSKGIDFGGDSMSDYRNPHGTRGDFQNHHKAYRRAGEKCLRKKCDGIMKRILIGGRAGSYCPKCQK